MIQTMSTTKEYKTTFTKQAKEILDISDPKSIARTIKENIEFANRDLFQEVINIFLQFQNNGCGIASWDNYLIHDKWKNSKN